MDSIEVPADGAEARPALAMITEPDLVEGVLRAAAAAGCELLHPADLGEVRRLWPDAPLVLLDAAAVRRCSRIGLPRRGRVVVVLADEPPTELWRQSVAIGAEQVIALPEAESWLVSALAEAAEGRRRAGPVLAVIGGRGGAGASVLAAAAAIAAVREGGRALLVDCDPLGGGLDLVLGAEDLGGLRWPDLGLGGGRVPAGALHAALPTPVVDRGAADRLAVLSCARSATGPSPAAVEAVVDAGRRAGETVVCDLPRYPTEAAVAALTAAQLTVLVVTADVRSCAAAARVAAVLTEHSRAVQLVVRGPAPGGIAAGDVARTLGLPLLTGMRPEPRLAWSLERGGLPGRRSGPLAGAARAVLRALRLADDKAAERLAAPAELCTSTSRHPQAGR